MKCELRFGVRLWDFRIGCQREYWGEWKEVEHNGTIPARKNFPLIQAQYEYIGWDPAVKSASITVGTIGRTCAKELHPK